MAYYLLVAGAKNLRLSSDTDLEALDARLRSAAAERVLVQVDALLPDTLANGFVAVVNPSAAAYWALIDLPDLDR